MSCRPQWRRLRAGALRQGPLGGRDQLFGVHALARLESRSFAHGHPVADRPRPWFLLDVIKICFQFGHDARRQRSHAGHVSHIHHLNPAGPALEQADRGLTCAAGRRCSVVADDKAQIRHRRRGRGHRRRISPVPVAQAYAVSVAQALGWWSAALDRRCRKAGNCGHYGRTAAQRHRNRLERELRGGGERRWDRGRRRTGCSRPCGGVPELGQPAP
jgi:hypothetical protein